MKLYDTKLSKVCVILSATVHGARGTYDTECYGEVARRYEDYERFIESLLLRRKPVFPDVRSDPP